MTPVLGFAALTRTLRLLTPGQAEIQVSGDARLTVDAHDENGALIVSHQLDIGAPGKLSRMLQKYYGQNPQWWEHSGTTLKGQPMYACLLHWSTGSEVYGDICQGYPDPKLAKMAAAKPAVEWLADHLARKKERIQTAATAKTAQSALQVAGAPIPPEPQKALTSFEQFLLDPSHEPDHRSRSRSDPRSTAPFEVATGAVDSWRPEGSVTDRYRPPSHGLPVDHWAPEPKMTSIKRVAAESLLKENVPKKVKKENGYSDVDCPMDDLPGMLDYGRVEHVDGRYGFGSQG